VNISSKHGWLGNSGREQWLAEAHAMKAGVRYFGNSDVDEDSHIGLFHTQK
jgi:Uri superfamily endonuclease